MTKEISQINPKINNLVQQIETGEVKIPPLQRPFVWKIEQIIELLESIYYDYPIGSILWWETNIKLPSERNVAGFELPIKPETHPFYYVLDGQQRLSSLYGVFCTNRTLEKDSPKEYEINADLFDIFFDINDKKFIHKKDCSEGEKYFALKSLFNINSYIQELGHYNPEEKEIIQDLYVKFSNYEIPIIVTKKRALEEVGIIFERVNNTGTKLDLFDLMVALTWTEDFHLQDKFKTIQSILEKKNFGGIKNKVLLQCLSCIIKESSKIKVITSLKGQEIRDNLDGFQESLKRTVDYLSTELSVKSVQLLPHSHQIVPLCYFFFKVKIPSVEQKKNINKWFWSTSFSKRFTGATDFDIDEDIIRFKKLAMENISGFTKLKYEISKDELIDTKFLKSNAYSRAFVILLANQSPKNLMNGVKIDAGEALSCFNKKEYHHIFPKKFLNLRGINAKKINSLCNFCLLPSDSNKKISDKAPSDYFFNMIPTNQFEEILQSNLLPIEKEIYQENEFESFLSKRANKVIEYLERKLL